MKMPKDKKTLKTIRNAMALYTALISRAHEREQMKEEPDVEELVRLSELKKEAVRATLMIIPNWADLMDSAPVSCNNLDELLNLIDSLKDKGAKK